MTFELFFCIVMILFSCMKYFAGNFYIILINWVGIKKLHEKKNNLILNLVSSWVIIEMDNYTAKIYNPSPKKLLKIRGIILALDIHRSEETMQKNFKHWILEKFLLGVILFV